MSTMNDVSAQIDLEDSPSVVSVLSSPNLLVRESLAGIVTALALIPEVISFSFVSGVDPKVALVSSIVLCLVMSVLGGRPAMVTAAAGSIALVIGPMVKLHGVGYILPTIILAGIIQIVFGLARPGAADALHPALGDDRFCQRARRSSSSPRRCRTSSMFRGWSTRCSR